MSGNWIVLKWNDSCEGCVLPLGKGSHAYQTVGGRYCSKACAEDAI